MKRRRWQENRKIRNQNTARQNANTQKLVLFSYFYSFHEWLSIRYLVCTHIPARFYSACRTGTQDLFSALGISLLSVKHFKWHDLLQVGNNQEKKQEKKGHKAKWLDHSFNHQYHKKYILDGTEKYAIFLFLKNLFYGQRRFYFYSLFLPVSIRPCPEPHSNTGLCATTLIIIHKEEERIENVSVVKNGDGSKMEEKPFVVAGRKRRGEIKREKERKKDQTHLAWLAAMGHGVSSAHGRNRNGESGGLQTRRKVKSTMRVL